MKVKGHLDPLRNFASYLLSLHAATLPRHFGTGSLAKLNIEPLRSSRNRHFACVLSIKNDETLGSTSIPRKLKVLCLHGYGMNGASMRDRSGGFRKALKKSSFEMYYPDAPFGCTLDGEDEAVADADPTRRAWWRSRQEQDDYTYVGWEESMKALCELWDNEKFDGVLGFSQGAAAAAMLCTERRPRFAIFVSGFVPRDSGAAGKLQSGLEGFPSLHVFGLGDRIVSSLRSRALANLFADAFIVQHDDGHLLPSRQDVRTQVAPFVSDILNEVVAGDNSVGKIGDKI